MAGRLLRTDHNPGAGVLLLLSTGAFAAWSLSGMETPLFTLLSFAGVSSYLIWFREGKAFVLCASALALGFSALTRPEGLLFFGVVLLDLGFHALQEILVGGLHFLHLFLSLAPQSLGLGLKPVHPLSQILVFLLQLGDLGPEIQERRRGRRGRGERGHSTERPCSFRARGRGVSRSRRHQMGRRNESGYGRSRLRLRHDEIP